MKETILVIGASGNVGSQLVQLLRKEGHNVVTTTSKQPTEPLQVQLDLVTGLGIQKAFAGVDKAFLLSPSGYGDQFSILKPLIQEAKRQGLKKVVLMSAMGANATDTSPLRKAEIELEKSGLNYNIIRPNWFMQNFHTFWISGIRAQGKILLPAGNAKVSFIDTRDISAVAAKLLTSNEFANQDFDLSGPDALDHQEVAKIISSVTEKTMTYEEITSQQFKTGLLSAGLPLDYADFLVLIIGFLKEGYSAQITSNVKLITGREGRSFANYAQDYKKQLS